METPAPREARGLLWLHPEAAMQVLLEAGTLVGSMALGVATGRLVLRAVLDAAFRGRAQTRPCR